MDEQRPAYAFINLSLLRRILPDMRPNRCVLSSVLSWISDHDKDFPRKSVESTLVFPPECQTEYAQMFVTGPKDDRVYRSVSADNPDEYIYEIIKTLENCTVAAYVDRPPRPIWWEIVQAKNIRVTLIRTAGTATDTKAWPIDDAHQTILTIKKLSDRTFASTPGVTLFQYPLLAQTSNPIDDLPTETREMPLLEIQREEARLDENWVNGLDEGPAYEPPAALPQRETPEDDRLPTSARERVVIVVDAANLNRTVDRALASRGKRIRLDYQALRKVLVGDRELVGAYYVGREPRTEPNGRFLKNLEMSGYTLELPDLKLVPGNEWDDRQITLNLPNWSQAADTIVLICGDGAHGDVLTALRAQGKRVEIVSTPNTLSKSLPYDKFVDLRQLRDQIVREEVDVPSTVVDRRMEYTFSLQVFCSPEESGKIHAALLKLLASEPLAHLQPNFEFHGTNCRKT